ncbi:efflux RND transporter periplasmic adaptor subunit [Vibrio breoganii]|jgi:Cu(I)/Ag(I) efflux system membrane fusion protein|uniref:efflux RND transporter periplasmic adaptor subunit n=1 Tax=Vibrio breoganii TaxID=553239 RepID=UPI000C82E5E3|nr:efflux RND transporter periplasmic adaptor subunit [Vibrio breoganii]PML36328.1 efflux transporter periplasmic adaptor subunit [Vibrio breoganii]PMM85813.1 efflux transporter periplasmic adaptor subunit [Vibrio breoganii]PMO75217.1 efflux transporter periplasmic adaptor subunit [Vibrio breoganii]PMO85101.1 efflux transporter periplasmic adaptor subunit [Vibrio breoganii]
MRSLPVATLALLVGGALGYFGNQYMLGAHDMGTTATSESKDSEPLYWVAPMDPNYRRDEPGQSPMGMDLIPVYEDGSDSNEKQGTVKINPAVENNLGVKSASASLKKLAPQIDTVGYIQFDESRLWQTNSRVSGWVNTLNVHSVGEEVAKDEVLFTLYSPELVNAQEELLNAYRSGRKGLVSGATERLISLGLDKNQINQIAKRGRASQNVAIKAPANGVIAELNVREGGYISPSQTIISAGPLDEVWIDVEVFERQSHWVDVGSNASMTLSAFPGRKWEGKVDFIYPVLDAKTRTLRVRLVFDNGDGALKPNMFASIILQAESEAPVLTIPRESVIRSGGMTRVVLSEGDGKYRSARIEVGREATNDIEVLAGLSEGDKVVTSAQFMLDSESSQSADLARINGIDAQSTSVWVKGQVTDLMADHRMATINHQPVEEWQWPGMVMNFTFADGVNIDTVQPGQAIDFEIQKNDSGQYEILDFTISDAAVVSELWVTGEISMLMADFGMLTVTHDPVTEWNWGAGEMNFSVDDAVDLSPFSEGQKVRFLINKSGSEPTLISLELAGEEQ